MSQPNPPRVAVLGLGNVLMQDDGIGVQVARHLLKYPPVAAAVYEIGTALLGHLEILEAFEAIIAVDAVRAGGPPGSIYLFEAGDARLAPNDSLHDLGLAGALRLIDPVRRPRMVWIVGVEPFRIGYGLELSEPVRAALPEVVRCVEDQVIEKSRAFPVHIPVC